MMLICYRNSLEAGMIPEDIVAVSKRASCLHDRDEVELVIDMLAERINSALFGKNLLVLCVMNGGLVFCGKLVDRLDLLLQLDYLHVSRYRGQTYSTDLLWKAYPKEQLLGRTVLIVDDILDEGATLESIVAYCKSQGADEVYAAILVNKVHQRKLSSIEADFVGLEIADHYLYGYGMDYKGYLRNAPGIFAIDAADL
jgi:hypoxanthine phosphoribosyltransferase